MIEQLTGLDSLFLYGEAGNTPMHIAPLLVYEAVDKKEGRAPIEAIRRVFQERLERSPIFRRKLVPVPMNLDHPYWVNDENFNLDFHVSHIALPKPGSWRQLCSQLARLHAEPLDRNRPLWEAYVIEGLDDIDGLTKGSFALFIKVHHAAADGAGSVQILQAIHDLQAKPRAYNGSGATTLDRQPATIEGMPTTSKLLSTAVRNSLRSPLRLVNVARRSLTSSVNDLMHSNRKTQAVQLKVARTRFSATVSAQRVFGAVNLETERIKEIRSLMKGATANDVVLAIVAGGLRQYLEDKNELPQESLVSGVPANMRSRSSESGGGNEVSVMRVPMATHIKSPLRRLKAISEATSVAKEELASRGESIMSDIGESIPPLVASLGIRAVTEAGLIARTRPVFNTIVSNVPGAQIPHYLAGARLVQSLGAAPCWDSMGLFHTVSSYESSFAISFQACQAMLPDPEFYEHCLDAAVVELYEYTKTSKRRDRVSDRSLRAAKRSVREAA